MPSSTDPTDPASYRADLDVQGALPPGLSGRLVGIDTNGAVHSLDVHDGRATYTSGHPTPLTAVGDLVAFNNSIFAVGQDLSVYELSIGADTPREVDFAGRGRVLATCPRPDPTSGELHLVARLSGGAHEHVVVTAGAMTRRSRPISDVPGRIEGLALGGSHVVYVADGAVGVTPRNHGTRTTWIQTGVGVPRPICTYQSAGAVVLLGLTPSLERWILHPDAERLQREVIDPTPWRWARSSPAAEDNMPRYVWTTGDGTISRHDVAASRTTRLDLSPNAPGDLAVIPAPTRPGTIDGGWLVGIVHDPAGAAAVLRVVDTADFADPAVACVRLPRPIPPGLRCEWLPSPGR